LSHYNKYIQSMKTIFSKILLAAGIVFAFPFNSGKIMAQADTVKIEYSEELKDSSDYNYKLKYKYLNYNLVEERNLLTLDLAQVNYGYDDGYRNLGISINRTSLLLVSTGFSYEHKITPAWAVGITNNFYYQRNGEFYKAFKNSTDIVVRYFYNKKNEIRNKYSANNFNGNYLGASLSGFHYIYNKYTNYDTSIGDFRTSRAEKFGYEPGITLYWGINTRINKFLFFDFAPYVGYSFDKDHFRHNYQFGIRLKAALGYGFH
jgi:hypothetical protein